MKQKINPNSYAAFKSHGFRKEEAEELDEISASTKASYTSKAKDQIKQSMPYTKKGEEYRDIAKNFIAKRKSGIAKANEAVEQMDELDKSTIKSYVSKKMKNSTVSNPYLNKSYKKDKENLGRAHDRLYGKKTNEDVEQMDEISKETAGKYLTAPMGKGANKYKVDASKSKYPNYETMAKHATNVHRALSRSGGQAIYKKPDYYKEESLDEARPSQRHPLEGHEYHKKSNEALVHIAKDAHAAAEAMKSHNTDAENKYRDQANDSATVRHFRKTSGMPDWYKKKYGHVNESSHNVPFDKPYKQDTGTTTDKSGAKHTPMSKVRNLARQAMKKSADRKLQKEAEEPATEPFNKNSKQMSRKAQIVKGASKGSGDAFQKEPELSATVAKN
jgi:hypothetical protein